MGAFGATGGNGRSINDENGGSTEDWGDALATKTTMLDSLGKEAQLPQLLCIVDAHAAATMILIEELEEETAMR
jgi:hypothetical protein